AQAAVGLDGVAVVAGLALLDPAVAARGQLAVVGAGVVVVVVAVVAALAGTDHSVAARGQLTAAQAGVVLVGVAVVALLARVLDPVTAHAGLADLGDAAQAVVAVRIAVAPAALGPERAVAVAIAVTRLAVAVTRLAVTVTRIAVTITAGPGRARIHAVAVDA